MKVTLKEITIIRPTGFDLMYWFNHNCNNKIRVTKSSMGNWWLVAMYGLPYNSGADIQAYSYQELLELAISYGFDPSSVN
jgi:hypothetical protein